MEGLHQRLRQELIGLPDTTGFMVKQRTAGDGTTTIYRDAADLQGLMRIARQEDVDVSLREGTFNPWIGEVGPA